MGSERFAELVSKFAQVIRAAVAADGTAKIALASDLALLEAVAVAEGFDPKELKTWAVGMAVAFAR